MAANNRSIEARWLSAPGVVLWAFGKLNEEEEQKHRSKNVVAFVVCTVWVCAVAVYMR